MHDLPLTDAVKSVLQGLINREAGAIVARLLRHAGRQDHRYAHLLGGEVESVIEEEAALSDLAERLGEPIDLGKDGATPKE